MNHIKILLALAAALFAASVQQSTAQITRFTPIDIIGDKGSTTTNKVTATTTNDYTLVLDVSNQDNVGLCIAGQLIVSNFCKPRLDFATSVDGVSYSTTNFISITCLGGLSTNDLSAGSVCYTTNLDVRGLRSLKLFRVANTDAHGILTNLQVQYAIKR